MNANDGRVVRKERLASLAQRAPDMRTLMNPARLDNYSLSVGGLYADFSKHRIDDTILDELLGLAADSQLVAERDAMFSGDTINRTEERAVLHTALRDPGSAPYSDLIQQELERIRDISGAIRDGRWRGVTGKPIRHIVNIGIGGSDLGPKMVVTALREYVAPHLDLHFVSNVDGAEIRDVLGRCDAETTLILISSKTFTTQETLINAGVALAWFTEELGVANPASSPHVIAVTASRQQAEAYGVPPDNIVEFWDFVGGRYSLWSAIGTSIAIAIGFDGFRELLDGAHAMDRHFAEAPFRENLPVLLGMIGLWYNNYLGAQSQAIVPYCERLTHLPSFLQQLDMESNGKRVDRSGNPVPGNTGAIVWGQTGTNGQHAFFQLLHQGTRLVPVDFIGFVHDRLSEPGQHRILLANMVAQAAALMNGEENADGHRHYPGNRPSTTLLLDELSPRNLGMLVALYEHRVFVQGIVWDINSFDQFGVELGKRMANGLLDETGDAQDASTASLMQRIGPA